HKSSDHDTGVQSQRATIRKEASTICGKHKGHLREPRKGVGNDEVEDQRITSKHRLGASIDNVRLPYTHFHVCGNPTSFLVHAAGPNRLAVPTSVGRWIHLLVERRNFCKGKTQLARSVAIDRILRLH